LSGRLEVRDLPAAFDERMLGYLGLEVPDHRAGVLQDIHWADAGFGYFPTYSLGNVMSVQIWEKACGDLGDLDGRIERGDFGDLREWLRDRKSTRLNSSHSQISYAVFCLKKKTSRQRDGVEHRGD